MSSLVIKNAVVPGTPPTVEPAIVNDGWFPNIDPAKVRDEQRIRDNVTADRLRKAIIGAIITVGNQLAVWQDSHLADGRDKLIDVPAPPIDGVSRYVVLYTRAVGAYAKAELVESYRDIDTTTAGQREADQLEPSIVELRRDAVHAVRDMLGRGRTRIELI